MKKRIAKYGAVISLLAIVLTFALAGCGQSQGSAITNASVEVAGSGNTDSANQNDSSSDTVVTTEKPKINASEIWKKYDADPDKNTPTYSGDQEAATGVITYIGKDDHGTDSMQISDTKGGTSYVLGVFGSADEMSQVSVGDTVTITGNFHIMSSTNMVVLKECKIVTIYQ